ncbi:peptidylprolyl isomerase [Paraglaciecola sp. L3A3]|uniref:peptidylprolyl isomerase n=1 Tax=Paraglaciecola sp. L3A3 TaxID=2686358 RepID=UPI00131AECA1|nr:peptidylprolyl isomerase [Paraglaciecola sp. L3A3]
MSTNLNKQTTYLCVFLSLIMMTGCDWFTDKAITQVNQFIQDQNIDKTKEEWKTSLPQPIELTFTEGKQYLWEITTNKGMITIQLMPEVAPMHTSSTIYLTTLGFYDNTIFHRVISGFMAQGGDPLGSGRGNPGYKYAGEFSDEVTHTEAGLLSMANSGPGTDGSQFFLTFAPTPWLDGKHTIFGKVIEGMEVLKILESLGSRSGKTSEEIKLISAQILVQ